MKLVRGMGLDIVVLLLVLAGGIFGVFAPLDNVFKNTRYTLSSRAPTEGVVFLAIDPESLNQIGVWPWPRRLHAQIIDRLLEADVAEIFFDIDFSAASNALDDGLLEEALERAGGYVSLAAFVQQESVNSPDLILNRPIERFERHAELAVVNVAADGDGLVRRYPYGIALGDVFYKSMASVLSGNHGHTGLFNIDYSIDAALIETVSVADLINGAVDPETLKNRQVVIGANALELRDTFVVPRFGQMPGGMLQILAAETLRQGRTLFNANTISLAVLVLGMAGTVLVLRNRYGFWTGAAGGAAFCLGAEGLAFYLQAGPGILTNTVGCHVALAGFMASGVLRELDFTSLLLDQTAHDRNLTQGILNRVITDNFDGVVVVAEDGHVLTASRMAGQMLGFDAEQAGKGLEVDHALPAVLATEIKVALRSEAPQRAAAPKEVTLADASGQKHIIEYVITLSEIAGTKGDTGPATNVACLTFRDVTSRRLDEKRLSYLAAHDQLTGALSRSKLMEIISRTLGSEDGRFIGMTVVMVDLSRFKIINETLGHSYGDLILSMACARLQATDVDCVARMGGDTFAAARAGILQGEELERFCKTTIAKLSEIYQLGEHRAIIGARVGVATTENSGFDAESLISHADMALSAAKSNPVDNYAVFVPEMDRRLQESQEMEIALRHAIERQEFYVLYQPQVALDTGELVGVEALVRWTHPTLGTVSPVRFIPIAEETGLILELGRWVLETACREALEWPGTFKVSVNVSPMQFEFGDLVADVQAALAKTGLPPERLDVEITEGVLISNSELVVQKLVALKALGVGVALDDFGTGYSSLSYLGQLPIDKIKIDRSFVSGLPNDQHSAAVVRAVMTLSESLGKLVVAEGIENEDQAWMLNLAGCQIGQGYLYGKPLSSTEIAKRIAGNEFRFQLPVAAG